MKKVYRIIVSLIFVFAFTLVFVSLAKTDASAADTGNNPEEGSLLAYYNEVNNEKKEKAELSGGLTLYASTNEEREKKKEEIVDSAEEAMKKMAMNGAKPKDLIARRDQILNNSVILEYESLEYNKFHDSTKISKTDYYKYYATNGKAKSADITVLTHGFDSTYAGWSNVISSNKGESLILNKDSIIYNLYKLNGLNEKTGESNMDLYVASYDSKSEIMNLRFYSYNGYKVGVCSTEYKINTKMIGSSCSDESSENYNIIDTTKHTVILINSNMAQNSNEVAYQELDAILDNVSKLYKEKTDRLPLYNLVAHSRGGVPNIMYASEHQYNVAKLYSMGTPYNGSTFGEIDLIMNKLLSYGYENYGVASILNKESNARIRDQWNAAMGCDNNIDSYIYGSKTSTEALVKIINEVLKKSGIDLEKAKILYDMFEEFFPYDVIFSLLEAIYILDIDELIDVINASKLVVTENNQKIIEDDLFIDYDSQIGVFNRSNLNENYYFKEVITHTFTADEVNGSLGEPMHEPITHNLEIMNNFIISDIMRTITCGREVGNYVNVINLEVENDNTVSVKFYPNDCSIAMVSLCVGNNIAKYYLTAHEKLIDQEGYVYYSLDITKLLTSSNNNTNISINNIETLEDVYTNYENKIITVSTLFGSGTGTQSNPYTISCFRHLKNMSNLVNNKNKYFVLTNDIYCYNGSITPITNFYGMLDGNGYYIHDLKITSNPKTPSALCIGFIGTLYGTVENLEFENIYLGNSIANSSYRSIGIIAGRCESSAKILNCDVWCSSISVSSLKNYVGGITGYNKGTIVNSGLFCSNMVGAGYLGGIAGYNTGSILDCYALCNTMTYVAKSGIGYFGGIVGVNYYNGAIKDCGVDVEFTNKCNSSSYKPYFGAAYAYNYGYIGCSFSYYVTNGYSYRNAMNYYNTPTTTPKSNTTYSIN